MPSTRLSASSVTAVRSFSSSSSVFASSTSNPLLRAVSVIPRSDRRKNGFSMSEITTPMVWVDPVIMLRASTLAR